ncbi:hypothetical protein C8Q77DRAFT_162204 [Trametes polyzona]|nr:hypothetical protein C8Q77DRAFT_162204 [Trametes polyzona]
MPSRISFSLFCAVSGRLGCTSSDSPGGSSRTRERESHAHADAHLPDEGWPGDVGWTGIEPSAAPHGSATFCSERGVIAYSAGVLREAPILRPSRRRRAAGRSLQGPARRPHTRTRILAPHAMPCSFSSRASSLEPSVSSRDKCLLWSHLNCSSVCQRVRDVQYQHALQGERAPYAQGSGRFVHGVISAPRNSARKQSSAGTVLPCVSASAPAPCVDRPDRVP